MIAASGSLALFVAVLCLFEGGLHVQAAPFSVVSNSPFNLQLVPGILPFSQKNVVVHGEWNETLLQTGWNTLKIVSNPAFPDEQQAYAAGFFEGALTFQQTVDHFSNLKALTNVPKDAVDFLVNHTKWLEQELQQRKAAAGGLDPYWTHVDLMWKQWNGLLDGLNSVAPSGGNWSKADLITLTSWGDLFDIIPALQQPQERTNWRKMNRQQFFMWVAENSHCTALVKVTENFEELFFGHVSWYRFTATLRIFKHITLNYNAPQTTAKTISMSSYPGIISSFDDYYVTSSGLSVIETSLSVLNMSMYDGNVRPNLLLYWMRTMIANRMARDAKEWSELIAYKNSGTYNNQWTILNLNLFTPGQTPPNNMLWVAEQMPGVVASRDVTDILRFGYWPSYNIPLNRTLYELGGYVEAVDRFGPDMNSYDRCVRARIFRRDQTSVTNLESFKHMLQYNNYEQDPISQGNPLYAISSRVDLDPHQPQCFGAYDAKVSSYDLWKSGSIIHAHSGPTPQQPLFGFNITGVKCAAHKGLATLFNFGWQVMSP